MNKVPKLRFPGFSGEWEKISLKTVTTGLNYGMNAAATEFDGANKYIRITDIDESTHKYNYLNVVSPLGELEEEYRVGEDDILFTRTGASVGKTYLYDKSDGILYFAGFLIRARVKKEYNSKFIFLQTLREEYNKWVKIMSMRSGQPGINSQEYASYEFYLPSSNEQQKIASFFSLIDDKIQKQQKKVEALQTYKKGIMQKIFSQEIRFKDENGEEYPEWESHPLGKLGEFSKGAILSKANLSEDGLPCILYGELYTTYGEVVNNIISKTNLMDNNLIRGKKNDVLIPSSGETAIDIATASCLQQDDVIIGGDLNVFRPRKVINGIFMSYQLTKAKRKEIAKVAQGASVVHLYNEQLKKIIVDVPVVEEQNKIASFFSLVDNKLEKEQEKLNSLNQWKKSLLQQMFI